MVRVDQRLDRPNLLRQQPPAQPPGTARAGIDFLLATSAAGGATTHSSRAGTFVFAPMCAALQAPSTARSPTNGQQAPTVRLPPSGNRATARVTVGPELLCARSLELPDHAMLGRDGRLYDRDRIAGTSLAPGALPDHTMTGAVNAWREHAHAPERCLQELRQAIQCPISLEIPEDPVLAADGYTYERAAIQAHFKKCGVTARSPVTNVALAHQRLVPGESVARLISAYGLSDDDTLPVPQTRYLDSGHPHVSAPAWLPDGPHRPMLESVYSCLDTLYALAPETPRTASATQRAAAKACGLITQILAARPPREVAHATLRLRAEVYCLTRQWDRALKDLNVAATPMDIFERTRRSLALHGLGFHEAADACLYRAAEQHRLTGNAYSEGLCQVLIGENLRHRHRYALAEQQLERAARDTRSSAAEDGLAKTRRSMRWRGIASTPMSDTQLAQAILESGRERRNARALR